MFSVRFEQVILVFCWLRASRLGFRQVEGLVLEAVNCLEFWYPLLDRLGGLITGWGFLLVEGSSVCLVTVLRSFILLLSLPLIHCVIAVLFFFYIFLPKAKPVSLTTFLSSLSLQYNPKH